PFAGPKRRHEILGRRRSSSAHGTQPAPCPTGFGGHEFATPLPQTCRTNCHAPGASYPMKMVGCVHDMPSGDQFSEEPMATSSPASSPNEIVIISHSPIFYWWPVWFVGFLMAVWTYFSGDLMAVVPVGTVAERERTVSGHDGPRDVLILPPSAQLRVDPATGAVLQPRLRMAANNNLGMIFVTVLCLVIVITNIHLRGLWSVLAILGILAASILLALLGWWDPILRTVGIIDVHINALGYFSIGLFLFAIWS